MLQLIGVRYNSTSFWPNILRTDGGSYNTRDTLTGTDSTFYWPKIISTGGPPTKTRATLMGTDKYLFLAKIVVTAWGSDKDACYDRGYI